MRVPQLYVDDRRAEPRGRSRGRRGPWFPAGRLQGARKRPREPRDDTGPSLLGPPRWRHAHKKKAAHTNERAWHANCKHQQVQTQGNTVPTRLEKSAGKNVENLRMSIRGRRWRARVRLLHMGCAPLDPRPARSEGWLPSGLRNEYIPTQFDRPSFVHGHRPRPSASIAPHLRSRHPIGKKPGYNSACSRPQTCWQAVSSIPTSPSPACTHQLLTQR